VTFDTRPGRPGGSDCDDGGVTRIVGGSVGGRRIAAPPGLDTRPTTDRAREALFATLATLTDLAGARVLDLYAGSGAVGLEALSRGAAHALLVDSDARAARLIRDNAAALGLAGATVVRAPVLRTVSAPPEGGPYDVVFADPPYALPDAEVARVLEALVAHGWLAADAVVVVERPSRGSPPAWPQGLEPIKQRRYGEGALWYGRRS
jgi:16S rRNA (guanine966-N2)-methyltransferase